MSGIKYQRPGGAGYLVPQELRERGAAASSREPSKTAGAREGSNAEAVRLQAIVTVPCLLTSVS